MLKSNKYIYTNSKISKLKREYIEPEKVSEEVINAINIVKEYCKSHEEFEDCRHCVLGDGIHNCGCSSPWLWNIRK